MLAPHIVRTHAKGAVRGGARVPVGQIEHLVGRALVKAIAAMPDKLDL
jgi:hypothetical protein